MTFDRSGFRNALLREEKSAVTVEKYLRDVAAFAAFAGEREPERTLTWDWKQNLIIRGYAVRSVNSMLASLKVIKKNECLNY